MPRLPKNLRPSPLQWAIAFSLALHGGGLFLPGHSPRPAEGPAPRLEARLAERVPAEAAPEAPAASRKNPASSPAEPKVLTVQKPKTPAPGRPSPQWPAAQKKEMDRFMDELSSESGSSLNLARKSLAMAREFAGRQARQEDEGTVALERLPDSPPVDPFSLEMYVDGLVKRLNRSAAFVRNDPRTRGLRIAAVQIRLNPNGSLRTFTVLDAADQQQEIEFIRSVVEQAIPFAPFPADIRKSAQSLAMTICILPAGAGGGGFGFTRGGGGKGC
jgi:hypothetical protein